MPSKYDYTAQWNNAKLLPQHLKAIDEDVDHIIAYRIDYKEAESLCGLPWFVIGCIHSLEAGFNFHTILANGDPLNVRTVHVPKGLIAKTWQEGVKISVDYEAKQGNVYDKTGLLNSILYYMESYNGLGYRRYGIPTPYLWSFTSIYSHGKYLEDSEFSASAISEQVGAAAILLRMVQRGLLFVQESKLTDTPLDVAAKVVELPVDIVAGAVAGAQVAVQPTPKATDFNIGGLPNVNNGTQVDPNEILAHDLLMLIGALIAYLSANGIISNFFTHWAYGLLSTFGGIAVAGLASFLRRVTLKGTNENVQHLLEQ